MADAKITIDADAHEVVVEAGKAKAAITGLGDQTRQASRAGAAFQAAGEKQMDTLRGLGRAARNASLAAGALGAVGFTKAIKDGFKFNAALESTTLAFTQLIGNGDEARAMLQRLANMTKNTPFGVTQLTGAARQLLAFGLEAEQVEKTMLAVGDAMAALGGDEEMVDRVTLALGQMQAKGKVSAEELLQLTQANIPAYQILQKELSLTSDQMADIGNEGITADVAIKALTEGMRKRFKGAAKDQAKTWEGAMSKIRDQYEGVTGAMTKSLFDETKKWLPNVQRTMDGITDIWNREDLSFEEKFQISRDVVDRELGPVFDEIERRLGDIDFTARFGEALNAAIPVVADAAGTLGVEAVRAFFNAFREGDPVTRALMAAFALSKFGGFAAIRAAGKSAGAQFGSAAGADAAAPMVTGLGGRLRGMGPQLKAMGKATIGTMLFAGAIDAATAQDVDFAGRMQNALSTITFGITPSGTEELTKSQQELARIYTELQRISDEGGSVQQAFLDMTKATNDLKPDQFRKLSGALDGLIDNSDDVRRELADLELTFESFSGSPFVSLRNLRHRVQGNMEQIRESLGTESEHAKNAMGRNIGEAIKVLGKGMDDGRVDTQTAMREIHRLTSVHTGASKEIVSRNFRAAADAMERQMKRGGGATRDGLRLIRSLMVKSLELYGISAGAAKALVAKQQSRSYGSGGLARGGLIQVGQPGEAGRDDVPAMLNGRPHVIARGENVAVFTRHQKQVADQRLAGVGGLSGLFSSVNKPNYMARGGFVQGANPNGLQPVARNFANRMFERGFSVTSAVRGGSGRSQHNSGMALDFGDSVNDLGKLWRAVFPLRGQFNQLLGPQGLYNGLQRFHHPELQGSHMDHIHIGFAGAVKGALGALIQKIKRVKVPTDMGVISSTSQAAVDTVRAAANKRLEEIAAADPLHGPGDFPGDASGNGAALMRSISKQRGWNFGHWWELDRRETSHGRNLANPTSSARLRGQFLDMNWGKYGPGSDPRQNPSMAQQIYSMARYIAERYGNPSRALGHHNAHNWYARGGMVQAPFVGAYEQGGTIPKDGFAYVHQGEEVVPEKMAAGGFVGPHRRLQRLVGLRLDAEIRSGRTLEGFKGVLDDLDNVVPEHIRSLQKRIRDAMADLRRRGVTIKERQRYDQLKDALGSVDEEADRRLDLISDSISAAVDRARDAIGEVELRMRVEGIDNDSAQGLERIAAAQRALRDSITNQIAKVQRAIARAQREGRDEAEGQLREQLTGLQRSLLETTANLAENARAHAQAIADAVRAAAEAARARVEARIGARAFHVEGVRHRADLAVRELELRQRLAGNQDTPEAMRARAGAMQAHTIPALQHQVGTLWQNWLDLATAGFHGEAERVKREARSASLDVLAAQADAADMLRQAAQAQKQAAEESQRALNDLLKEQLAAERERRRLAEAQFPVFAGFAGLAAGRLVGRFPHGADFVARTGLAEIHRGEMIIPDPQGPFQQTARQMTKPGPPPVVRVFVDGDVAPLMGRVRAEIDGRAARVVSEQLGRRGRQFTTAPGR